MRTDQEKELLIKAIDASKRKFIIISPDYVLLAFNEYTRQIADGGDLKGRHCYEAFYDRQAPCEGCTATRVMLTGK